MAGEHTCAIEDCALSARPEQLMCFGHWKATPLNLQRRVNATWRRFRYEPEAYREARDAAIAWWRGRHEAVQPAGQGRLL